MSVTSNWEWTSINRAKDYSVVNYNNVFRENWSVTRKRISNADYVSELGTSSNSLSGYNGGVTETVAPPTYTAYSFGTTTSWVTAGVLWVPTGLYRNGVMSYRYNEASKTNSDLIPILFLGEAGSSSYIIGQVTTDEISAGTWPNTQAAYTALGYGTAVKNSSYTTLTGQYNGHSPWGSSSSLSSASNAASFYCTADVQSYDQTGVDWYTQTQTWQSKTPWA